MTNAFFVETITVTDPDTNAPVELEVYKDEASGGLFAIDSSYLSQVVGSSDHAKDEIPSPFNKYHMVKLIFKPFTQLNAEFKKSYDKP